jgi:hypothetical protein
VHEVDCKTSEATCTVQNKKKNDPTCFDPHLRPSLGGPRAVLYAATKLNSVDVRLFCSCIVCGRYVTVIGCMHVPGVPILVKSGHRIIYITEFFSINVHL